MAMTVVAANGGVLPSLPVPTDDPVAIYQATLMMKQNMEIRMGTTGTAYAAGLHGPAPRQIALNAALRKV